MTADIADFRGSRIKRPTTPVRGLKGGESGMPVNVGQLKAYLKERHLSQATISRVLRINQSTLNMILSGNRGLYADLYMDICQLLDVPAEQFYEKRPEIQKLPNKKEK